jgi:hypothetical protein
MLSLTTFYFTRAVARNGLQLQDFGGLYDAFAEKNFLRPEISLRITIQPISFGCCHGRFFDQIAINYRTNKLSNESNKLILDATDKEPVTTTEVAPEYTAISVIQSASPGIVCKVTRKTPPGAVKANAAKATIIATATARKT